MTAQEEKPARDPGAISHDADPSIEANDVSDAGVVDRTRENLTAGVERARDASDRHVSIAVPFRAVERNRRVAASVLAGGIAYRLFLWLLPFGLIVGGALGLGDADSIQDAAAKGGLPAVTVDAIGDAARAADTSAWWMLAIGVPLLLWAGYTGAKAVTLVHALVFDEPPPRTDPLKGSLAFTGVCCVWMVAVAVTWWLRDEATLVRLVSAALMIAPLAALWLWVSLKLPHRDAPWRALVPGALLVAVGFEVLHVSIVEWLVPKLEKSTSMYGGLGATATFLFFMYLVGRLVVTAPVLNSALHEELRQQGATLETDGAAGASPG